ncbi:5-formyltetrahydrofolate cyclo-ligase [Bombilactobacillus thymidiniphilus]|uniref:5-formyltetrahydrofolate cyclo-ligase n=1 Tax=Bombilactobacillus thymidiniphilus TaxID=2923363 RepID=A0ABY4PCZ2_9LACO|nr:5-formyltetrahydrofolate cyclo-ligase [Bombilactobacillus thymidiniphilus]UQS83386.1 5-formyltetrahydrofolate cyclo-ligase [Bombilactobacillus thymidiniphilus]
MLAKSYIRKEQPKKIAAWLKQNTESLSKLYDKLFMCTAFQMANTIATTISMEHELSTKPIIQRARQMSKQVYVPQTLANNQMQFRLFNQETVLKPTQFGVLEPNNGEILAQGADLTIVPALAVSLDHNQRIGFGAGYYDRYLAKVTTMSISLAMSPILFSETVWQVDDHDQPINQIIY